MKDTQGYLELSLPDGSRQEFELSKSEITLGRGLTNDIVIMDSKISRTHASIEVNDEGRVKLIDLGSTNGSRLNGEKVIEAQVNPGDTITVGSPVETV